MSAEDVAVGRKRGRAAAGLVVQCDDEEEAGSRAPSWAPSAAASRSLSAPLSAAFERLESGPGWASQPSPPRGKPRPILSSTYSYQTTTTTTLSLFYCMK
jgi:hypothetical protein